MASADHNQQTVSSNLGQGTRSLGRWLLLLLAFSVFAWGTSYKLSLYKNSPRGSVTPAKLCKLTSDSAKRQVDHSIKGHEVGFSGLPLNTWPATTILVLVLAEEVSPRRATASLAPLQAAPILHLRPPPTSDHPMFL